ncbi:MAG: AI-2E family transporter [Nanoarchaeota archaeon]
MEKKSEKENRKKYFIWTLTALLILVSYFLIKPYIVPIISGFVLAYISLPIYNLLNKKISPMESALLCILVILIVVLIPLSGIVTGITQQATNFLKDTNLSQISEISNFPIIKNLNLDFQEITNKGVQIMINLLTQTAKKLPSIILSLFIILVSIYYILINWKPLSKNLKKYLPFEDKNKVASELSLATKQIIYGNLLISLIGFIVSAAGFYLLGINNFLFYSAIIGISLFFPIVGPVLIWLPLAIYYILIENYPIAIGIFILGLILSNIVDNLLRMKILGSKANINPLIMLIGILGGVSMFGIFGFIIGPLILVYTIKLLQEILE